MKSKNYQEPHKIKNNWEGISKLITLETQLLEKIEYLEKKLDRLWKLTNNSQ